MIHKNGRWRFNYERANGTIRGLLVLIPGFIWFKLRFRAKEGQVRHLIKHQHQIPMGPDGLVKLKNAHLVAQPLAVINSDWELLWPFSEQLGRSAHDARVLWQTFRPGKNVKGVSVYAGVDGISYYHWLIGTVPKILFVRQRYGSFAGVDQVFVGPKVKESYQSEILHLLNIKEKTQFLGRRSHVVCEEVVLPPSLTCDDQRELTLEGFTLLRQWLDGFTICESKRSLLLFISRRKAKRRKFRGEDELFSMLEPLGFNRVDLEDMPWVEQLNLFKKARIVVGGHGAGLANIVVAQPGASLIEIQPPSKKNPCFKNLAAMAQVNYYRIKCGVVRGVESHGADGIIDRNVVFKVLKTINGIRQGQV